MRNLLIILFILLLGLPPNAFSYESTAILSGEAYSGAYAGLECFDKGLCLAGFRSDYGLGNAKIRRSTDYGKTWSDFIAIKNAESARAYYFSKHGQVILASGGAAGAVDGALPNIFRSSDNGITWDTVLSSAQIKSLPECSNATGVYNIIHLGGNHFIAGLEGVPILIKSDDDGKSWSVHAKLGNKSRSIRRMYRTNNGAIFALAFGDGLYQSLDNGTRWTKIESAPSNIFSLTDFGNGVYLAGTTGESGSFWSKKQAIYRSEDYGQTWYQTNKVQAPSELSYVRTIVKIKDRLAYAFVAGNEYSQQDRALTTYASFDEGKSWQKIQNLFKSEHGELNAVYDSANPAKNIFLFATQPDSNIFMVDFN